MQKTINNKILPFIGILFIIVILWNRFLRIRMPKDLTDFSLSIGWLYISFVIV